MQILKKYNRIFFKRKTDAISVFSVYWDSGYILVTTVTALLAVCLIIIQCVKFFKLKDLQKKSTDKIGVLFIFRNLLTNTMVAAAYGKPCTPVYLSLVGLFIPVVVGYSYAGLWEWVSLFCSATIPFLLGMQYFIIGYCYRRRNFTNVRLE